MVALRVPKDESPKDESPKRLAANVYVGGEWYGPDYLGNPTTPEVEAQITNPAAWSGEA